MTQKNRLRAYMLVTAVLVGCGARVHTGAATSPVDPELGPAAQLGLHGTYGVVGMSLRGLAAPELGNVAMGIEFGTPPGDRHLPQVSPKKRKRSKKPFHAFSPNAALGVHVIQLDWTGGDTTLGAGSPYLQVGGNLCRVHREGDDCVGLTLEGSHLVRFGAENQTWVGASLVVSTLFGPPH